MIYEILYNKNHLLSIVFNEFEFLTGAVHGYTSERGMIINTESGIVMSVKDFFKPDSDWKTTINKILIKKSQEFELLEEFKGMDDSMDFYITETGMCFSWDPYMYTPYALGIFMLEIPYSDLDDILQDEFSFLIDKSVDKSIINE